MIAKLQATLQQMEKSSRDFVSRTQQDAEKQSQSAVKTWEGKQARMQQDTDKLTLQLNTLVLENHQTEKGLRKVTQQHGLRHDILEKVSQQHGLKHDILEKVPQQHGLKHETYYRRYHSNMV